MFEIAETNGPVFKCGRCGHEQDWLPLREIEMGREPCSNCRTNEQNGTGNIGMFLSDESQNST